MNDRYLYRAKRCDTGEWVEGNCINDGVTGQVFIHASGNSVNERDKVGEEGCLRFVAFEVDPTTICQCTELKDKNGKMIWENEIIKCKCGIAVVVWDKSEWRIKWVKDNIWRKDLHFWVNDENEYGVEVIGNIFDNPELLEVGE